MPQKSTTKSRINTEAIAFKNHEVATEDLNSRCARLPKCEYHTLGCTRKLQIVCSKSKTNSTSVTISLNLSLVRRSCNAGNRRTLCSTNWIPDLSSSQRESPSILHKVDCAMGLPTGVPWRWIYPADQVTNYDWRLFSIRVYHTIWLWQYRHLSSTRR